jgi:hypothetical protein
MAKNYITTGEYQSDISIERENRTVEIEWWKSNGGNRMVEIE